MTADAIGLENRLNFLLEIGRSCESWQSACDGGQSKGDQLGCLQGEKRGAASNRRGWLHPGQSETFVPLSLSLNIFHDEINSPRLDLSFRLFEKTLRGQVGPVTHSVPNLMKTRILPIWVFLIAIVFGAGPRDAEWEKVEEARKKDQPKTQIELLAGIEKAALADEAWAEAARAMVMRIATEGKIEGPGFVIKKLDAELVEAPAPVKPVLRALAARWMQRYYHANQWRFARRSSSGQAVGDDLETWDLARILKEVDTRMQLALSVEESLKATPIAEMADLMSEGELGDEWRPSLFDFVANRALIFYSAEEVAVSRPKDAFTIKADSPVFGTVEEFLGWKPETKD